MNEKQREYHRKYYRIYREKTEWKRYKTRYNFIRYWQIKLIVFGHYGLKCAICGDERVQNLAIDHIQDNGAEHRKQIGIKCGGINFYLWLIKNNFPPGYQSLCEPCNQNKWIEWRKKNGLYKDTNHKPKKGYEEKYRNVTTKFLEAIAKYESDGLFDELGEDLVVGRMWRGHRLRPGWSSPLMRDPSSPHP